MNPTNSYTSVAIRLHWLTAIALTAAFSVGVYMHDLPLSPDKLRIYSWHKWAGVCIFLLVAIRLTWRCTHRPPGPPAGMPIWQHRAAEGAHRLLYALMLAIPLSGWLMSSAKGYQTVLFGIFPLPDLLQKDASLGEFLQAAHRWLNFGMAALVSAHLAAALKHYWIDRDDVLLRMLPFLKQK